MIEKAISCLNHGGKKLALHSSKSKTTQRALHSAFWSHGAGEIELPPWWNGHLKNPDVSHSPAQTSNTPISFELQASFLDFLYPPKTLQFAQQLSGHCSKSDKPLRRRFATKLNKRIAKKEQRKTRGKPVEDGQSTETLASEERAYKGAFEWNEKFMRQATEDHLISSRKPNSALKSTASKSDKAFFTDTVALESENLTGEEPVERGKSGDRESLKTFTLYQPSTREDTPKSGDLGEADVQRAMEQAMLATDELQTGIDSHRQDVIHRWKKISPELGQAYEAYLELLDTTEALPQLEDDFVSILSHETPIISWQMENTIDAGAKFLDALLIDLQEKTFPQDKAHWSEKQWAFFIKLVFFHPKKQSAYGSDVESERLTFPTRQRGVFRLLIEASKHGKAFTIVRELLDLTIERAQVEFANSLLVFCYKRKFDINSVLSGLNTVTSPLLARWIADLYDRLKIPAYNRLRKDLYEEFQPNRRSYLDLANLMTEHLLSKKVGLDLNAAVYEKVWDGFLKYKHLSTKHFILAMDQLNSVESHNVSELTPFVNVTYKLFNAASGRPDFVWEESKVQKFLHRMASTHHHHCWTVFQYYRNNFGFHGETHKVVLRELSNAGETEHWEDVFADLQVNEPVDKHAWIHQLLIAHAKRANVEVCKTMLESIEKESERFPDLASWNAVLYAYVKADDMPGALKFHDYMISRGFKQDISTSMILLRGWATRGEHVQASVELARIRAEGHELNAKMIYHLVSAYLFNQNIDNAEQLLYDTMDVPTPDTKTEAWNAILKYYGHQGKIADMNYIHSLMTEHGIAADENTYAAFMIGFSNGGVLSLALKIIRDVMPMHNIVPTIYHWNILMQAFVRHKKYERALQIYQSLKKEHLKPDITTQSLAIQAMVSLHGRIPEGRAEFGSLRSRAFAQAEEFLRQSLERDDVRHAVSKSARMGQHGQPIDQVFASLQFTPLLMKAHELNGQQLEELVAKYKAFYTEKYPNQAVVPPIHIHTAIAEHYLRTNNHSGIDAIWQEGHENMTKFALRTGFDASQPDHILRSRSNLLDPLFRVYMSSLMHRGEDVRLGRTIIDITRAGWRFAAPMWNSYIAYLAQCGEVHLAFQYAEQHLIDGFPGWPRTMRFGMSPRQFLEKKQQASRRWQVKKPAYSTMVWLAYAYAVWRRKNAFNAQRSVLLKQLWDVAPRTITFVTFMPRIQDKEQCLILRHPTWHKVRNAKDTNNDDSRAFLTPDSAELPNVTEMEGIRL